MEHCMFCGDDCREMGPIQGERVLRCRDCGAVFRNFGGHWFTDTQAWRYLDDEIKKLAERLDALEKAQPQK